MNFSLLAAAGFRWDESLAREKAREVLAGQGKRARRMNRFIEIALAGAVECCRDRELSPQTGIYLATRHGDARDTLAEVTEIREQRMLPMPVAFIGLSGNMAGYHIASQLGLTGPNVSVSTNEDVFGRALELAALDLEARAVPAALVGHVEDTAEEALTHWLLLAPDNAEGQMELLKRKRSDTAQPDAAERIVCWFSEPRNEAVVEAGESQWVLRRTS